MVQEVKSEWRACTGGGWMRREVEQNGMEGLEAGVEDRRDRPGTATTTSPRGAATRADHRRSVQWLQPVMECPTDHGTTTSCTTTAPEAGEAQAHRCTGAQVHAGRLTDPGGLRWTVAPGIAVGTVPLATAA